MPCLPSPTLQKAVLVLPGLESRPRNPSLAPQQGACKLTLNVKNGIIEEALVETIGCSGMTHSAAMAAEILQGKTILEALNSDLVCDAINTAMREIFLQIVYGRSQSAFSDDGLAIGAPSARASWEVMR